MKTMILKMPGLTNSRGGAGKEVPARYAKYAAKEMAKTEKILKVILSSPQAFCITFVQLLPLAKESLFLRLLNLKGIPRSEHPHYLQSYRKEKAEDEKYRKAQKQQKK
eukprot:CAMPEP_0117056472 /NCGR_PEP_ID=MMETSP0472-20121206/39186_1 /TAXON_ID=693140 ORGANISM="Tiarina fusus, Strain LIS" /NCGR_SAMPLE_ID=MMETSP0472 /ASSEMBLY_ACC=CAM_ASM_000603 /LENGTH=107 /DNA_ID=CAMNT_0004772943 /DNA_START=680 /DNA_END=1003 /DNA_ORIENTATION=-